MATVFSHAIAAASLGAALPASPRRARLIAAGVVGALVPDVDVLWSGWDGAPEMLAHRGLTHSPCFALLLAVALASTTFLGGATRRARFGAALWLFVATASHGVLDALTDGGEGVAFLAPFSSERWFLPWRPIAVSPLLVGSVLRTWSDWKPEFVLIARTELEWIVVPSLALACAVALMRRLRSAGAHRRSAWNPAAALAVVVASLVPIRTIRPARPPMELALLLHASDLVVVAKVDSIEHATTVQRSPSGWVRQIDDVRRRGRRAHAEVVETLRGTAMRALEFFVLPHDDETAPDASAGRTDLFLLTDAARGGGEPPVWVVLAHFTLVDVGDRRSIELPERVTIDGAHRRTLPFEELQRMIAASNEPARSDK